MPDTMNFNGKEYKFAPLRCKHLKRMGQILKETKENPEATTYEGVDRWMPFIFDSLKENHPDVKLEDLEEMTLAQFTEAWQIVTAISGVSFIQRGEPKAVVSTGKVSTAASPSQQAGTIVQ